MLHAPSICFMSCGICFTSCSLRKKHIPSIKQRLGGRGREQHERRYSTTMPQKCPQMYSTIGFRIHPTLLDMHSWAKYVFKLSVALGLPNLYMARTLWSLWKTSWKSWDRPSTKYESRKSCRTLLIAQCATWQCSPFSSDHEEQQIAGTKSSGELEPALGVCVVERFVWPRTYLGTPSARSMAQGHVCPNCPTTRGRQGSVSFTCCPLSRFHSRAYRQRSEIEVPDRNCRCWTYSL